MPIRLKHAWGERISSGQIGLADLLSAIREGAIREGAVLRVRPKAMTFAVIITCLLLIMLGSETGSEIMQRIAAPMVGGMVTAPLLSMFVIPAAYLLMRRPRKWRLWLFNRSKRPACHFFEWVGKAQSHKSSKHSNRQVSV